MEKTTNLVQLVHPRWAVVDIATGQQLASRQSLAQALAAQRKIERDRQAS